MPNISFNYKQLSESSAIKVSKLEPSDDVIN